MKISKLNFRNEPFSSSNKLSGFKSLKTGEPNLNFVLYDRKKRLKLKSKQTECMNSKIICRKASPVNNFLASQVAKSWAKLA